MVFPHLCPALDSSFDQFRYKPESFFFCMIAEFPHNVPYFNPRSPWGERPGIRVIIFAAVVISIHAPRAGSDLFLCTSGSSTLIFQSTLPVRGATTVPEIRQIAGLFQSTLPVRGATFLSDRFCSIILISIHAPRAGNDRCREIPGSAATYFNPRSPCGERLRRRREKQGTANFNPRSPCGERPPLIWMCRRIGYFNPRSPCGERRGAQAVPGRQA